MPKFPPCRYRRSFWVPAQALCTTHWATLPFETGITRGANLTGLDTLLRGAAEASFN
jgi:hypothetical protein